MVENILFFLGMVGTLLLMIRSFSTSLPLALIILIVLAIIISFIGIVLAVYEFSLNIRSNSWKH